MSSIYLGKKGYVWKTRWEANKPYIVTKFQDDKSSLIAVYCDITRPVEVVDCGFTFINLYLDVWFLPGHAPIILDEAVTAGYITSSEATEAQRVANELIVKIQDDPVFLNF